MSVENIGRQFNIPSPDPSDEKQMKVLQFLKKIKLSRDRAALAEELLTIVNSEREVGENIYYQLLHSDLVPVRRFALDFYCKHRLLNLKAYAKNIILLEDDADNLKICLSIASGTLDRSELQPIFNFAIAKKSGCNDLIMAFLQKECAALNIDYGRMLENARTMREQERKKRLEKYDKNVSDEGVTLGGELAKNIKNPAVKKYAAAFLIALAIVAAGVKIYEAAVAARSVSAALEMIDSYKEADAESLLAGFCDSYPENMEACFHLHRIYCENYKIIEANRALARMISNAPLSRFTALGEVRNALFSSELKSAAAFFSKSWGEYASFDDAAFLKARFDYSSLVQSASSAKDYEALYSELETLYKKNVPGYKPYIVNLMITSAASGGIFDRARPYYLEALKTAGSSDFKTELACAYFAEKSANYDQAITLYDRALKEKDAPDVIMQYAASGAGRCALITSKHSLAADYFLKMRETGQPNPVAYIGLLEAYGELGDVGGLNSMYAEACRIFKDELMVHYSYAAAKMKMGEYEDAIKGFKAAIAIKPDMAAAHYNIGRALSAMADKIEAHSMPWNKFMDEAYQNYKKCLSIDPAYYDACISLGTMALAKSPPDYGEAETHFLSALKTNARSKEALFNLLSLAGLKNDQKMAQKYKTLIESTLGDDEDAMVKLKNYGSGK
ncbi:MAG TPA: tetratricopeptide repeat protein [Candidatus Wallbacteria bacterium]|nr:tetratricopeptide repeat protein [Candidatus Wallbacteria bacterium]